MKKKITILVAYDYDVKNTYSNEVIAERVKRTLNQNGNPSQEIITSIIVEDVVEPKTEVYARKECIFQYCPTPELCKKEGRCVCTTTDK